MSNYSTSSACAPPGYHVLQTSPALSADGKYVYAFNQGTLKRYALSTGSLVDSLKGLQYGAGNFGGDGAVAVDADYIHAIDAVNRIVYVYDLSRASHAWFAER